MLLLNLAALFSPLDIFHRFSGRNKKEAGHPFPAADAENRFCLTEYPFAGRCDMTKQTFEEALEKLEQITKALEEGDLSLEDSLKYFDEGVKLAQHCSSKLEDAQKKIEILLKKDDRYEPSTFEGTDDGTD